MIFHHEQGSKIRRGGWRYLWPHLRAHCSSQVGHGDYESHGGGDLGLISALPRLLSNEALEAADFIEGHRIGFAVDLAAKERWLVRL